MMPQARFRNRAMPQRLTMNETAQNACDLWVFGYGSLMWRPGFAYEERRAPLSKAVRRSLCVYSFRHRGTKEKPGLVLGLDRGGSCRGVVYRVAAALREGTLAYLTEREQMHYLYKEQYRAVELADGTFVTALCYVVDRSHEQYSGRLSLQEMLRLVRQGEGESGLNADYVRNTHAHLRELGIVDAELEQLVSQL
jgi:glutathione-specific gamma-glutamylcyclotransferase